MIARDAERVLNAVLACCIYLGGLGPGGLLLATLPLILAPMLSYLFTPMIIPVTATIAAGRKRKRRGAVPATNVVISDEHVKNMLRNESSVNGEPDIKLRRDHSSSWSYAEPRLKEIQVTCASVCIWNCPYSVGKLAKLFVAIG